MHATAAEGSDAESVNSSSEATASTPSVPSRKKQKREGTPWRFVPEANSFREVPKWKGLIPTPKYVRDPISYFRSPDFGHRSPDFRAHSGTEQLVCYPERSQQATEYR